MEAISINSERRAEERAPDSYLIRYSGSDDLKDESAVFVRYAATLNVSESGLCFMSPKPFKTNHRLSFISTELWDREREGVVRWCAKVYPSIYRVGIALL